MWKLIKIYKDDKEFIAWTKRIEKKLKGEILGQDPTAQDRLMMEAQTSGVRPAR